ncbi:MAG: hypothetical protein DRI95_00750 [Bacteroidetes bacterium]|nr:MAG: hypothetical protein DRI95_00750 [Bacteroidota bacterium]
MSKELKQIEKKQVALRITEKDVLSFLDLYGFSDLSTKEKGQFLKVCQMNNLNPFNREAHIVAYGQGKYRTFSIITGFQVYLERAEKTNLLTGWHVGNVEKCKTAKVDNKGNISEIDDLQVTTTIYRKDFKEPFTHTVKFSEQAKKKKDGTLTEFWMKLEQQLKKVSMSQSFRLCFSGAIGGLPYTDAEVRQAKPTDAESDVIEDAEIITEIEKKELPETEFKILLEKLKNFEILISGVKSEYKDFEISESQQKEILKAGKYTDAQLTEIVELIDSGKYTAKDFRFSLTEKQTKDLKEFLNIK